MTDLTPRLALPLLIQGQAQKEMFHNESLVQLDVLVAGAVEEGPRNSPPGSPAAGQAWIVGTSPTGAWSGQAGRIATWNSSGWRFLVPAEGCPLWVKSSSVTAMYRGGAWVIGTLAGDRVHVGGQQVVGARGAAIADPSGGSTVDAEARSAVAAMLAALRTHGLIAS